jgi:hypothetical protein
MGCPSRKVSALSKPQAERLNAHCRPHANNNNNTLHSLAIMRKSNRGGTRRTNADRRMYVAPARLSHMALNRGKLNIAQEGFFKDFDKRNRPLSWHFVDCKIYCQHSLVLCVFTFTIVGSFVFVFENCARERLRFKIRVISKTVYRLSYIPIELE